MTRTFIDSGVLIAAARGETAVAIRAMEILDDGEREFLTSDFVRLEVLPKALYNGKGPEAQFYELFFDGASESTSSSEALVDEAYNEATTAGLSAVDALHVAAARRTRADELVTTEQPTKPLFRVADLAVRSLDTGSSG